MLYFNVIVRLELLSEHTRRRGAIMQKYEGNSLKCVVVILPILEAIEEAISILFIIFDCAKKKSKKALIAN